MVADRLRHVVAGETMRRGALPRVLLVYGVLSTHAVAARTLEAVKEANEIDICLQDENPPFSDRRSEAGVFLDLGRVIANGLGVKVKETWLVSAEYIRKTDCDLIPAVADVPSDDPIKRTKPYMIVRTVLVTRADARPLESLADIGHDRVAVLANSYARHDLNRKGLNLSVAYLENADVLDAVANGRVFAGVVTLPAFEHYVREHQVALRANEKPLGAAYEYKVSVGLRRADRDLAARVDAILASAATSGRVAAILHQYGLSFSPADR